MINNIDKEGRCSMNATLHNPATRTSGKVLRRILNKYRTWHRQSTDRIIT
jgi:hypothetical protein